MTTYYESYPLTVQRMSHVSTTNDLWSKLISRKLTDKLAILAAQDLKRFLRDHDF